MDCVPRPRGPTTPRSPKPRLSFVLRAGLLPISRHDPRPDDAAVLRDGEARYIETGAVGAAPLAGRALLDSHSL